MVEEDVEYEMTYKLTWKKDLLKNNHEQYLALLKQVMYSCEQNTVPKEFYCNQKILSDVIDPELLARRLGLIVFQYKENYNQKNCNQETFILENSSDNQKFFYTKDLKSDKIEPLRSDELLLVLPPKFKTEITIDFVTQKGCDNARSSTFEGFRYDSNDEEFNLLFDQIVDVNSLNNNCIKFIESYKNEN